MFLYIFQAKILDHDNVNYLKKILGDLAMALDQVEAELEKRKLEYEGVPVAHHHSDMFLQCNTCVVVVLFMLCCLCRSEV